MSPCTVNIFGILAVKLSIPIPTLVLTALVPPEDDIINVPKKFKEWAKKNNFTF